MTLHQALHDAITATRTAAATRGGVVSTDEIVRVCMEVVGPIMETNLTIKKNLAKMVKELNDWRDAVNRGEVMLMKNPTFDDLDSQDQQDALHGSIAL